MQITRFTFCLLAVACLQTAVTAQTQLQLEYTVVGPVGTAPVIVNFSDGSYDIFDVGTMSSAALEDLAETGSPGGFMPPSGGPILGPGVGPGSPPIFAPGASSTATFTIDNANTLLQIAAMILPSNDWFIGNDTGIDISGFINSPIGTTMTYDFATTYDAGTEEEDFAFSPGNGLIGITDPAGGGAADFGTDTPGGVVTMVSGPDPFSVFDGIPAGFDTTPFDFTGGTIATLTVTTVPEPTSAFAWLLLPIAAWFRRR